jgi:hypothetical protein
MKPSVVLALAAYAAGRFHSAAACRPAPIAPADSRSDRVAAYVGGWVYVKKAAAPQVELHFGFYIPDRGSLSHLMDVASLSQDLYKFAVELRQLAYTMPGGHEDPLVHLSERMVRCAGEQAAEQHR